MTEQQKTNSENSPAEVGKNGKRMTMTETESLDLDVMFFGKDFDPKRFDVYLLKHNLDINAKDEIGRGLMVAATYSLNPAVIDHLISKGADINERDANGLTPLHHLARKQVFDKLRPLERGLTDKKIKQDMSDRLEEFRKHLVSKGADENAVDNSGKRPADYIRSAEENIHKDLHHFTIGIGNRPKPDRAEEIAKKNEAALYRMAMEYLMPRRKR